MSLEQKIEALTAAVEKNNVLLERNMASREEALAATTKVAAAIADTKPPKATAAAAKAEAAAAAAAKLAEAKAVIKQDAVKGFGAKIDAKYAVEQFGAYVNVDDKAERKVRMAKLRPIVTHFGLEKLSGLTDEMAEESLRYLDQIVAGAKEIVFETSEAETEVEDDDDLM